MAALALAISMVSFMGCSKNDSLGNQEQKSPELISGMDECARTVQDVNEQDATALRTNNVSPYDSVFVQYSNSIVEAFFEKAVSGIGEEEYMIEVEIILNSSTTPTTFSIGESLEQLGDSSYRRMFDAFFMNVGAIGANRSAAIAERELLSFVCNTKERNACLCALSYMKTMMASVESMQDYFPGPWYYDYLDCMRKKHSNMNWIEWTAFVLGLPGTIGWEVASCIWDATHQSPQHLS